MARQKKSPVSSVVVVALALLMFVAAVGIGVSMLKPAEEPEESVSESVEEPSSEEPSEDVSSESSETTSSEVTSSQAASSTSASASSTSSEAVPVVSNGVFDPASMGDSGFSNISNFKKINADVKGWIKIPGTNINYPVLHSSSGHYYLDHDINKQSSHDGVIYADPYVKFGSRTQICDNTVLYGHNWTNYSANPRIGNSSDIMFAQLTAYHHLNFAKSHPYIYYSTESEEMVWCIFAAFYTDINFAYNYAVPPTSSAFQNIISGAKSRSRHIFDVPVSTSDKVLTLSTCTRAYGKSDKQRFVVMAKLMPKGSELKAVSVTTNPNPVLPNL